MTASLAAPDEFRTIARRIECEQDGLYFHRYFMRQRLNARMLVGPHHHVMQQAIDRVVSGEYTRLIINVPPGYTKTEMASIGFMARGLALNPRARFMHLSYSEKLALLNSTTARGIVLRPDYQAMWPRDLRQDANSKSMWWTNEGGGVYATSTLGQVTGFRAGHMEPGFFGAMCVDDPIKPADVMSETKRQAVNDNYSETIASRLALESTPVVVIMQRLHYNDLSGYLLRGGSGEKWHHLCLPAFIDNAERYPEENTHGIEIPHGLPDGWLWPAKHNEQHRTALQSHRRKWGAQYQQAPKRFDAEGALWTEKLITAAREPVNWGPALRTVVGVDPAVSNLANSDLTGIVPASAHASSRYRVLGDYSLKGSPGEWANAVIRAVKRHNADAVVAEVNQGGDLVESNLRANGYKGRIIKVHASKGKYARAEPIASLYEQGLVSHDPAADLTELETELLEYVPLSVKKSPDRLDAKVWALTELSAGGGAAVVW